MPSPMAGYILEVYLSPLEAEKIKKNVTELSLKQTIKPRALNVTGSAVFNGSVFLIFEKVPIKYSPV